MSNLFARLLQNRSTVAGTCRLLVTASVSRMWLRSSVRFSTPVYFGSRSSGVSQRHRQKSPAPTTSAVSARCTPRWCTGKPSTWRRAWTMSSSSVARCLLVPHQTAAAAAAAARTHLPIFTCGHHLPSTLNVSWNRYSNCKNNAKVSCILEYLVYLWLPAELLWINKNRNNNYIVYNTCRDDCLRTLLTLCFQDTFFYAR